MTLLDFLLRTSRHSVALSVLAGVVSGVSGVALIALIQAGLGRGGPAPGPLAWAFAGLCLLAAATRTIAQAAMIRLAQGSVSALAIRLCEAVLALPLRRFETIDPAGLLAVLTEDVVIVANALIGIPMLCINGPIVIVCMAYIGWLSPTVLLCGLGLALPAIAASQAIVAGRGLRRLRAARRGQDALVGHFRALIDGFRELKQHDARRAAFLAEALRPTAAAVRDNTIAGLSTFAAAGSFGQLSYFGFLGFLLFVLPAVHDPGRAALGGAALAVLYLMSPLDVLLTCLPMLGRAQVSLRKIEQSIPLPTDLESAMTAPAAGAGPDTFESLRLEGVTYAYGGEPGEDGFVLGPIDLELRPGELVFLVGGNGSGKTTLVKLLAGLYEPDAGTILLDGRPVDPADRGPYRRLFSVVFADGHLFPTLLGLDPHGLDGRASELLSRLGLGGKVKVQDGTFSTTDLSIGQRRRLALAGALLEDRPICIFDEWAAHQDPHSKAAFYRELVPDLKDRGKALLVISHDEGYFSAADRVVSLRDGLIREEVPELTGDACL